ncbi:hypothetical protein HPP92_003836 [Vanilla planifolia]|uniref:Uncharacterized protein n=1 Tax=Vanilla planifolia TaxID=51239 RepID=A0A835S3Y8_VANPL|nr:hypothetical protein HPP92_003836 [Vanilla planifolia]
MTSTPILSVRICHHACSLPDIDDNRTRRFPSRVTSIAFPSRFLKQLPPTSGNRQLEVSPMARAFINISRKERIKKVHVRSFSDRCLFLQPKEKSF